MKKFKLFALSLIALLCFGIISVNAFAKETISIEGLTYTSKYYDKSPIAPTGTLTHEGYTGTINILYEGIDGTTYTSTTAPTNAGSYKVTYSIPSDNEYYTGSKVYTFEIYKADPIPVIPSGLTGIAYNMLSTVELPSGFVWFAGNIEISAGTKNYIGLYCPTDTENYNCGIGVNIPVYGKSHLDINARVEGGNGEITPSYINGIEGENYVITFTPDVGYMIDTVTVNGELVTVTSNTYTLSNITSPKNVVVTYKKIPFTIVVDEVTGATVSPIGTTKVEYGDNRDILIKANSGYRLKSVKVNGVEMLPLTENKITITNITENQKVVVEVEKIKYEVINGNGQKHIIGKNEDAVFRIDADKDLFRKVYLNNQELDSIFYTITEGSTVITLKQEFINNLLPGTYKLRAVFSDGGEANTTFVIEKQKKVIENQKGKESNPNTGDQIMISLLLGSISLIGLLGTGYYIKKDNI